MISEDLLKILACPLCRGEVEEERGQLVCARCRRRYPIRDGIPAMRPEDALPPETEGEASSSSRPEPAS